MTFVNGQKVRITLPDDAPDGFVVPVTNNKITPAEEPKPKKSEGFTTVHDLTDKLMALYSSGRNALDLPGGRVSIYPSQLDHIRHWIIEEGKDLHSGGDVPKLRTEIEELKKVRSAKQNAIISLKRDLAEANTAYQEAMEESKQFKAASFSWQAKYLHCDRQKKSISESNGAWHDNAQKWEQRANEYKALLMEHTNPITVAEVEGGEPVTEQSYQTLFRAGAVVLVSLIAALATVASIYVAGL